MGGVVIGVEQEPISSLAQLQCGDGDEQETDSQAQVEVAIVVGCHKMGVERHEDEVEQPQPDITDGVDAEILEKSSGSTCLYVVVSVNHDYSIHNALFAVRCLTDCIGLETVVEAAGNRGIDQRGFSACRVDSVGDDFETCGCHHLRGNLFTARNHTAGGNLVSGDA